MTKQEALKRLQTAVMICKKVDIDAYIGNIYDSGKTMVVIVLPSVTIKEGKLMAEEELNNL